jgi:hypothetical protein
MKALALASVLLFALSAKSAVLAAKILTPQPQLRAAATHIIVGKIVSISDARHINGDYATTTHLAKINISEVEKGGGLSVGDVVEVRYLSRAWTGRGSPPPGDSGHSPLPKPGEKVRAYLVNNGYNGAGYTTDGHYDVYYKNGFEILQ